MINANLSNTIEVKRLCCGFGGNDGEFRVDANGLSISVPSGVAVFVGENGAGKSTFFKGLAEDEDITIFARDIEPCHVLFRYVPQSAEDSLFTDLSVHAAFFVLSQHPLDGCLGLCPIPPLQDLVKGLPTEWQSQFIAWGARCVQELSRGQQTLLAIATAAAASPESMLLLDEPTSGLDQKNRQLVLDLLSDIGKSRYFPLGVITHDKDLVERFHGPHFYVQDGLVRNFAGKV